MPLGHRNSIRKIPFTLMVCGVSGTGRTSFVNALCNTNLGQDPKMDYREAVSVANGPVLAGYQEPQDLKMTHLEIPVAVNATPAELIEGDGTRILLTVVDTPGFGDNIDNRVAFEKILGYVEYQFDEVLGEESKIRRNPRFKDNRVHVCLYFIDWTGHGLRELDVDMMRQLGRRVNVIPILSRADSLTEEERYLAKEMILDDIAQYEIPIYRFPSGPDDDAETVEENEVLTALLPFAMVSGTEIVTLPDGSTSIGRIYPWGVIDSMNPLVSDFCALKTALLGSHIHELRDLTHDVLYENYRTEKLSGRFQSIRESRVLDAKELADHSYYVKQAKLLREQENIRDMEMRVQQEIEAKKKELQARESALREIEARISREVSRANSVPSPSAEYATNDSPNVPQPPLHQSMPVSPHTQHAHYEDGMRFSGHIAQGQGLGIVHETSGETPSPQQHPQVESHNQPLSSPPLIVPKERSASNPINSYNPSLINGHDQDPYLQGTAKRQQIAEKRRSISATTATRMLSQLSSEESTQNATSHSDTINGSTPEDSMRPMNVPSPYTQGM